MHVNVDLLPDNARVWIYASATALTLEQETLIEKEGMDFTNQWTAHQIPVKASFQILHHRFMVFVADVDANQISGCGIDKSVQLVQTWEKQLGLTLFNRLQLEFLVNNQIITCQKHQINALLASNQITEQTPMFDKTILTLGELRHTFTKPMQNSWIYKSVQQATNQH